MRAPLSVWLVRTLGLVALAVLAAGGPGPLEAQRAVAIDAIPVGDSTTLYRIRLHDGGVLVGRVVAVSRDSVVLFADAGRFALARSAIRAVEPLATGSVRGGVAWPESLHQTRLVLSPTAFPLQPGEGYYSNFWIFLSTFAVGVTERLTVGAGLTTFPTTDLSDNTFFFLPKYTVVERDGFAGAIGVLAATAPDFGSGRASLGILYGVTTFGHPEGHLTLGAGWGYVQETIAKRPVLTIGGLKRTSSSTAFITENWIFPVDNAFVGFATYGVRFIGDRLSADLAFGNAFGGGAVLLLPGIPLVGFAYRF
jgi:hypothetical protein